MCLNNLGSCSRHWKRFCKLKHTNRMEFMVAAVSVKLSHRKIYVPRLSNQKTKPKPNSVNWEATISHMPTPNLLFFLMETKIPATSRSPSHRWQWLASEEHCAMQTWDPSKLQSKVYIATGPNTHTHTHTHIHTDTVETEVSRNDHSPDCDILWQLLYNFI